MCTNKYFQQCVECVMWTGSLVLTKVTGNCQPNLLFLHMDSLNFFQHTLWVFLPSILLCIGCHEHPIIALSHFCLVADWSAAAVLHSQNTVKRETWKHIHWEKLPRMRILYLSSVLVILNIRKSKDVTKEPRQIQGESVQLPWGGGVLPLRPCLGQGCGS